MRPRPECVGFSGFCHADFLETRGGAFRLRDEFLALVGCRAIATAVDSRRDHSRRKIAPKDLAKVAFFLLNRPKLGRVHRKIERE